MKTKSNFSKVMLLIGIGILQFIAAMLVLLLVTMLFPRLDFKPEENPILFVILLWLTYSAGIYVIGWLSLRLGWRTPEKQYGWRLLTTLLGTFIPLLGAFLLYPRLEPGNPLFFICIITGIIGFLLPEWLKK